MPTKDFELYEILKRNLLSTTKHETPWNIREYEFSLTRILPYKDRVVESVKIRENTGQWKAVLSQILCSVNSTHFMPTFFLIWTTGNQWKRVKWENWHEMVKTHFSPMFHFYTLWKRKKTFGFRGYRKWTKMG